MTDTKTEVPATRLAVIKGLLWEAANHYDGYPDILAGKLEEMMNLIEVHALRAARERLMNAFPDVKPADTRPFCCHIADDGVSCKSDGEIFEIMGDPGHPYDDATHACLDHIGALLGTPVGADYENKAWVVYPVATA